MRVKNIDIADDVADVLRRSDISGETLALPAGQLERKLYERVAKVLAALGGKWNRKANGFLFPAQSGVAEALSAALADGKVVDRKRSLELFETPVAIAARMGDIAARISDHIGRDIIVLEPSAGTGRLLEGFRQHLESSGNDVVIAIDIDARNCEALRQQGVASEIVCGDFITLRPEDGGPLADVILMNPPFSGNQDIAHVTHAFRKWLAPGGVLVAIMSPHFTFANDAASRDFRHLLTIGGEVRSTVEALPNSAFRAEGTEIATRLVTIRHAA